MIFITSKSDRWMRFCFCFIIARTSASIKIKFDIKIIVAVRYWPNVRRLPFRFLSIQTVRNHAVLSNVEKLLQK